MYENNYSFQYYFILFVFVLIFFQVQTIIIVILKLFSLFLNRLLLILCFYGIFRTVRLRYGLRNKGTQMVGSKNGEQIKNVWKDINFEKSDNDNWRAAANFPLATSVTTEIRTLNLIQRYLPVKIRDILTSLVAISIENAITVDLNALCFHFWTLYDR